MQVTDQLDDWRRYVDGEKWADYSADNLIHAFVIASEKGDLKGARRLRTELEGLRAELEKIVPAKERVDGIERTSDFKSPEETSDPDRAKERHMKWAAHWLHRTIDILNMDFTDPKPCPPPMVEEARQYL